MGGDGGGRVVDAAAAAAALADQQLQRRRQCLVRRETLLARQGRMVPMASSDDRDRSQCASYMKVATGSLVSSLLRDEGYPIPDVFVLREGGALDRVSNQSLPLVDLAALGKARGSAEYQELVSGVVRASREWGCFQIVNHGVPMDLIAETQHQIRKFFSLPFEQKARIFSPPKSLMGYACGGNRTSGFLWQEGLALNADKECLRDRARRVWPEGNPEFCSVVGDYVSSVSELAVLLLEILTSALGVNDPRFLNDVFVPGSSTIRFNYYLPCPQPSATYGSSPLTDIQALSILHPDDVGGIEVHRHGKWIPVQSRQDSLLVNIGDALQVFSNDRYVSVEHRAIVNTSSTWLTMGYYLTPSNDTVVAPPPELVNSEYPARYRPFTYEEYDSQMRAQVLSPDFKYNLGKTFLNRYRLSG